MSACFYYNKLYKISSSFEHGDRGLLSIIWIKIIMVKLSSVVNNVLRKCTSTVILQFPNLEQAWVITCLESNIVYLGKSERPPKLKFMLSILA